MSALQDGQIYRWRWSDKERDADSGPYRAYHCKSQIAVVRKGRLIDTYWGDLSSERAVDPAKVEATLWAEESWPTISERMVPYYDPSDIADTRHSNNSRAPIYLRPGAVRSTARILEEIAYREEKAQAEIRSANWDLERLATARVLVEAGKLDEVYF